MGEKRNSFQLYLHLFSTMFVINYSFLILRVSELKLGQSGARQTFIRRKTTLLALFSQSPVVGIIPLEQSGTKKYVSSLLTFS